MSVAEMANAPFPPHGKHAYWANYGANYWANFIMSARTSSTMPLQLPSVEWP
jgi:hypothetical protein